MEYDERSVGEVTPDDTVQGWNGKDGPPDYAPPGKCISRTVQTSSKERDDQNLVHGMHI